MSGLFNMAVATIFAREFLEMVVIIGEFRTAILMSDMHDEQAQKTLLRTVTTSALAAAFVAILVVAIVAIPLVVLSTEINDEVTEIIEGVSKIVAAICVMQLSLKMPKWLGFYKSKKAGKVQSGLDLSPNTIRFNVAWNIWREVAECGIFLLPSLLAGNNLGSIAFSAVIGTIVGVAVGLLFYVANRRMKNKLYLAIFSTLVVVFLSAGLLVGGAHEFEEVWGESRVIWEVENEFWSSDRLPMVILKPFGYSSERTLVQITCYWCWLGLAAALHYFMYWRTKKIEADLASGKLVYDNSEEDIEKGNESQVPSTADDENEQDCSEGKPMDDEKDSLESS